MTIRDAIRGYISTLLDEVGHQEPVGDDQSLILSGLLDSLAVVHIVVFMEETFSIDFSRVYFDQNVFDTVDGMVAFVKEHSPQGT